VNEDIRLARSRPVRFVYGGLGFLFLGLGIVGVFVPLLPTTINLILAAFFFFRSNERMYRWMIGHPRFGPALRDYRAGLGIPRKAKVWAVCAIAATFSVTIFLAVDSAVGIAVMVAIALAICAYILTRPTREKVAAAAGSGR